ncbi:MAG: Fic family protein [Nanoarchaeota archaeon]
MAFIHVKRIGDRKYYTLRISIRKDGRVITKDICNLGSDISKIDINSLEKKYHTEIRKSYNTIHKFIESNHYLEMAKKFKLKSSPYFSNEQLNEIEAIRIHFHSRFLKLDKLTQGEVMENFLINFAVNSTSIEGNTITLKQAHNLFKEDIIPKNKSLREVHDLTNTKKAWDYLYSAKLELNEDLICRIHDMLVENIDQRKGFRSHNISILGQPFKPSPAMYVAIDLKLLLDWCKKSKGEIHPLALATFFHHKFENIHPFSDGNGRTGRMIMDYILFQSGYPPMVISRRFRKEYLAALNNADKSLAKGLTKVEMEHYKGLVDFIFSQFKLSYWDSFLV